MLALTYHSAAPFGVVRSPIELNEVEFKLEFGRRPQDTVARPVSSRAQTAFVEFQRNLNVLATLLGTPTVGVDGVLGKETYDADVRVFAKIIEGGLSRLAPEPDFTPLEGSGEPYAASNWLGLAVRAPGYAQWYGQIAKVLAPDTAPEPDKRIVEAERRSVLSKYWWLFALGGVALATSTAFLVYRGARKSKRRRR